MATATPIGPGAGSVVSVTIHKMTVSTTQTEPIIFDGKLMSTTHSPCVDLRGFMLWVRFDVRDVSQGAAQTEFTVKVGLRRERGALSGRRELGERRRARLKGSSARTKNRQCEFAGKVDGSEFKRLR